MSHIWREGELQVCRDGCRSSRRPSWRTTRRMTDWATSDGKQRRLTALTTNDGASNERRGGQRTERRTTNWATKWATNDGAQRRPCVNVEIWIVHCSLNPEPWITGGTPKWRRRRVETTAFWILKFASVLAEQWTIQISTFYAPECTMVSQRQPSHTHFWIDSFHSSVLQF